MTNKDLDRFKELHEKIIKRIFVSEQELNEFNDLEQKLSSQLNDAENYKNFNEGEKPHRFLREGDEDDCQVCGFPERFHQQKFTREMAIKLANADKNEQIVQRLKDELKKLQEWNNLHGDSSECEFKNQKLLQSILEGKSQ